MPPLLTIGMATFEDYSGCYETIQKLRIYHAEAMRDVEILVIDNQPSYKFSSSLKGHIEHMCQGRGVAGARYVAMPEPIGTSAPRQRVFDEATGDAVLCIDSHVSIYPGAIARLIEWYRKHPGSNDLLSGPIVFDGLGDQISTQFDGRWRGEMWGTWGQMWQKAGCKHGCRFAVVDHEFFNPGSRLDQVAFASPGMNPKQLDGCWSGGKCEPYPTIAYTGHERVLEQAGYKRLGLDPDDEFEIAGMGLGLFSCRRAAWRGFNPEFRGFGGEEMYIHEKFRRAGGRCLCLGFLKWNHRFVRPEGGRFPLSKWTKARNYVIGHRELGLPLDPIKSHFVVPGAMPPYQWDALVASDPPPVDPPPMPQPEKMAPDELYEHMRHHPRDLDRHFPKLRELAAGCERVVEFSSRRESGIALLAGAPKSYCGYNAEMNDPMFMAMVKACAGRSKTTLAPTSDSRAIETMEPCDVLFLNSPQTKADLSNELVKFAPNVRRFIALHDTLIHGRVGESGAQGMWTGMKIFLHKQPDWFVAYHTNEQFGLTVLGRLATDKPPDPIAPWPPGKGPGTEFHKIVEWFGVRPDVGCDCIAVADEMDRLRADGCVQKRDDLISRIQGNWERWRWKDKILLKTKAGLKGAIPWLRGTLPIKPLDPVPGLFDMAVAIAREQEAVEAAEA